jgi:polyisoprenoid-binding protein YceI
MFVGRKIFVVVLMAFSAHTWAGNFNVPSGNYVLDTTHGYITVSYSHLGFSNPEIGFNSFSVNLIADAEDPANSQVKVIVDAASVDSRVDEFDEHLNGEDFFETAKYPQIAFVSTRIKQKSDNSFDVYGNLTIKGVTKPVILKTNVNKAANHPMLKVPAIGLSATTKVQRTEFGLGYGVPFVSDFVTIAIEVELMLQP